MSEWAWIQARVWGEQSLHLENVYEQGKKDFYGYVLSLFGVQGLFFLQASPLKDSMMKEADESVKRPAKRVYCEEEANGREELVRVNERPARDIAAERTHKTSVTDGRPNGQGDLGHEEREEASEERVARDGARRPADVGVDEVGEDRRVDDHHGEPTEEEADDRPGDVDLEGGKRTSEDLFEKKR